MDDRRIRSAWAVCSALWAICFAAPAAFGVDSNRVAVEKVLGGLNHPHSVAIRPEGSADGFEIFVAESGAGRVIKIRSDKPDNRTDIVSGFSTAPAKDDRLTAAGVHSLYFLDHIRLLATGGDEDGLPFVRLYELPEPESPLTADQHKQEAKVPEGGKEQGFKPRVFGTLGRTQANDRVGDYLVVAAPIDSASAQLVYVPVRGGTLGDAAPAPLKDVSGKFQISGLAVGNSGYVVVATNAGNASSETSRLLFFNPIDQRVVMQIPIDLQQVRALAYSPRSGNLFAASASTGNDGRSGVYRIDRVDQSGTSEFATVKIADVRNPTALAFTANGVLYVTATGESSDKNSGTLFKLTGDL